ncbi:MAG: DNA polymerase IV [Eubacteriales bacterium]|nr:DNA polymerase IV [Eubacteriales bacterium]
MREKIIFHIDVNSAFLSWSAVKRLKEDPDCVDLRTIPAVVGGDPSTRHGIVTAKSVPAKRYGIHTADTIASAMRRCPGLVVIPSDFQTYREYSHRFMDILKEYTREVEQASIDEAYMDATEICRRVLEKGDSSMQNRTIYEDGQSPESRILSRPHLHDTRPVPEAKTLRDAAMILAERIRRDVREQLGFTVNVGISSNRLLAKMASDFQKPDKTHTLFPEEVAGKMWPLPIGDLYGCGRRTAERLRTLGITTIGDAAAAPLEVLEDHLGEKAGRYIHNAACGIGRAAVYPVREDAKSYSNEFTTSSDITADTYEAEFLPLLHHLCDKVAGRLQRDGVYGRTVVLSVKTDDFRRRSARRRLTDAANDAETIYRMALSLSDRLLLGEKGLFSEGAGVRLVGAGVTDLEDGSFRQVSLFDWMGDDAAGKKSGSDEKSPESAAGSADSEKQKKEAGRRAERAARLREMEAAIRRRYGKDALQKGTHSQPANGDDRTDGNEQPDQ